MPLITTLIPAYRPDYLGALFSGLRAQTLQDFCVVLSDDSPGGDISRLLAEGHFDEAKRGLRLQVLPGPGNARLNHQQLLDHWAGSSPLVHVHMDDDLVFPDFYRAHAAAHAERRCSLSVSRRWLAGPDGQPTGSLPLPAALAAATARSLSVDHAFLCASALPGNHNWLGELSHMVLSAQAARRYPRPPAQGLNYYGLLDIGLVLEASRDAPVTFLHEHLGLFRQHGDQTTHKVSSHGGRIMFLSWVLYALVAWKDGQLGAAQAVQGILTAVQRIAGQFGESDDILNEALDILAAHGSQLPVLHERLGSWWRAFLASQPGTDPTRYARHADAVAA